MTLQTAPERLTPAAVAALGALRKALGCSLEAWRRDAPGVWRRVAEDESGRGRPLVDSLSESGERLTALLERVVETAHTCTQSTQRDSVLLAAPAPDVAGAIDVVGVAMIGAAGADFAVRVADAALRELQYQQEIDWLKDENYVFSHQVTDDFEELTFLRAMATRLVVDDTSLDIGRIVDATIGDLREMIGAETIYFVTAAADGGLTITQSCPCRPGEVTRETAEAIARLAGCHRAQAADAPCVKNDLADSDPAAELAGVRQFLMVPIGVGERQFGWFVAVNRTTIGRKWAPSPLLQLGHDEFGTWEASLLNTAATLLASHASNLDLIREKEHLLINTVRSLVSALDAKDAYTRGHSERVALFSKRIAETLGYDSPAAEKLYLSGLLHDVGKIGVSDAVLRKPDKLTEEEFAEIKKHPDEGWAILRDLEQLNYVLPGVLHHHERVGGGGYPDGLVGDGIPLDARIMAVADAYDAMTSDRAYRGGMPHDIAIEILRKGAGSQWDADVVTAFLSVIDDIISIRYGYRQMERPIRRGSALSPTCQS
jgi:response regulator RpfG family c-di-GMP phosphodiesterase